jgi:hypothetical protein
LQRQPQLVAIATAVIVALALVLISLAIAGTRRLTSAPGRGILSVQMPQPTITSPQLPLDVDVPAGFQGNPIAFFDDFSWRSFIALVWPVEDGQRGVPDTARQLAGPGPRVFETLKATWEIFHADGSAPSPWSEYEKQTYNPCADQLKFGQLSLASFSKFSHIGQAFFGSLTGPIASQNGRYVLYLTGMNKAEFDLIDGRKWYIRANLPASVTFPNGSVSVKSAWIEMDGIANPDRYYRRKAFVLDLQQQRCEEKEVGLVGLHIVQKTPSRPQWIWSSFEHVDNCPPASPGASGSFAFHNGIAAQAMPKSSPFQLDPPVAPPVTPFNIVRVNPIHPSTTQTNSLYRSELAKVNSVWKNYQLVMTQWPTPPAGTPPQGPVPADQDGQPDHTFPGTGGATAFANTTLETFEQEHVDTGCMACHDDTRVQTDFVWTLQDHAFEPNIPALLFRPSFLKLQNRLKKTHELNVPKKIAPSLLKAKP